MRKLKPPLLEASAPLTVERAQSLYRDYGEMLMLGRDVPERQQWPPTYRDELKAARRLLEQSYGPVVRATSEGGFGRAAFQGKEQVLSPVWTRRGHVTIDKPQVRKEEGRLIVTYHPLTGEVTSVTPE